MFKVVNRSRSMKSMRSGGGAPGGTQTHGPESPVLGSPGLVSSFQQTKEDSSVSQNVVVPFAEDAATATAAAAAAVAAVETRNTYRHRPLPTPPRSKASSTMAERPSTSGGLSPHNYSTTSFRTFDRRMSKDDMYIRPHSSARGGYKSYHIPIRDNPASPLESPGDFSYDFSPARTFTVRTQTPDSMDSNMGTIAIGMAIGSPTHPPPEFTASREFLATPIPAPRNEWQPQASSMSTSMVVRASPEPPQEAPEPVPPPKQKSGRWKLFGRSKSKRLASSPVAISQPMNLQQSAANRTDFDISQTNKQSGDLGRRNTERKPADSKPAMMRSQTAGPVAPPSPRDSKAPKLLSRMASTRSTRSVKKSDISAPVHVSMGVPALPPKPSGGFLDVEIPSITMERYSIMFGNVLGHPQGSEDSMFGQQPSQPSSSLLARRQATLDRLKTVNAKTTKEDEERERTRSRRATSPQPLKSPAFSLSLFPATPSESANNPPQSPRYRSNTSPAFLASPQRASCEHAETHGEATRGKTPSPGIVSHLRPHRPQEPPAPDFVFGPEQSGLVLESPAGDDESEEIHLTEQLKPTIYEPAWQMMTPADSTAPSSTAPSAKDHSPASASSVQTHVTKPSFDGSEPNDALRAAVEISIARQISISRQQRRMLRPLKTNAIRVGGGGGSPGARSPVATITVGKNERLSSTKSATPTLISPGETFEQQIAQNRKSERIILEGEYA